VIKLDSEQAERFYEFVTLFESLLRSYGLELHFAKGEIRDTVKGQAISCYTHPFASRDEGSLSSLVLTEGKK